MRKMALLALIFKVEFTNWLLSRLGREASPVLSCPAMMPTPVSIL